jgi:hypothetical protein
MSVNRKMRREAERAQKKQAIPPVPKYAEEQNLAWVRCHNMDGTAVAVVEDMIDWMVIFDSSNPESYFDQAREDWSFPDTQNGGSAWGNIMIHTLNELSKQNAEGKKTRIVWNEKRKALMFGLDSEYVNSIHSLQREVYGDTLQ